MKQGPRRILFALMLLALFAVAACKQPQPAVERVAGPNDDKERAGITYFEASASGINIGETVTLRWNVPGARSVSIDAQGKGSIYNASGSSGSLEIKPEPDESGQAKYKLTAYKGSDGAKTSLELSVAVRK